MGKKSAPKAPDYTGAAQAQGAANREAAYQTALISNPNVKTHLGSQRVEFKPTKDGFARPYINQTLSPTEQAKYDQGAALDLGLLDTAQGGLSRVNDMMGTQFDMSGLQGVQGVQGPATGVSGPSTEGLQELSGINMPQMNYAGGTNGFNEGAGNGMTFGQNGQYQGGQFQPTDPNDISRVDTGQLSPYGNLNTDGLQGVNAVDSSTLDPYTTQAGVGGLQQVTDAIRSRGDVDFADKRQALDNDLRIRGFTPGSEGFRKEMQGLERQQNDFNQQALLAGGQEQSRIAGMENARRQQGLGEQQAEFDSQYNMRGQDFGERGAMAQFAQQNRAQGLNEMMQQQTADQSFGQQGFDQQERVAQFQQAMRAQGMSEQAITAQINAANRAQQFGERTTQAGFDQSESQRTFGNQQDLQAAQGAERQRQIQEQAYLRQLPLNEINALRTGTQVNAPQFQQYSGAQVAAAPLFQGAQAQGNFDLQNAQNRPDVMGGLFGLGGAALGGGMFGAGGLFGK